MLRIALYQPDIPQNTGAILRTAACLGAAVDIIGPTGFDMTDKALRRAGLDYLEHVEIIRHASFAAFLEALAGRRLVLATTHAAVPYAAFAFAPDDVLLFGRESAGVPPSVHAAAHARIRIPLRPPLRSLNLSVATGIILAEAIRQTAATQEPELSQDLRGGCGVPGCATWPAIIGDCGHFVNRGISQLPAGRSRGTAT